MESSYRFEKQGKAMRAAVKYGGVQERVSAQMSRAQALRLKSLAEEAYTAGAVR